MLEIKQSNNIGLLDISGAFDNVKISHIISNAIKYKLSNDLVNLLNSILSNRTVQLDDFVRNLVRGCLKGDVLSPLIWNLAMTDLLEKLTKFSDIFEVAFANDLATIFIYKSVVIPTLTYGFEIWYRPNVSRSKIRLRTIQRKFLLAITNAYCTIPNIILYYLLDLLPVDYEIEKFLEMQNLKSQMNVTKALKISLHNQ